jgi:hypothetical protein
LQNAHARTLTPALYIKSARAYEWTEPSGSRTIYTVGEIANDSSITFENIWIHVRFFDQRGEFIEGGVDDPVFFRTFPGQRNPFAIYWPQVPPEIATFDITLAGEPIEWFRYVPLEIASANKRDNEGAEVFGEIRNNTTSTIVETIAAVTLYDAAGDVVDVSVKSYDDDLQPGAMLPFTISTGNEDPSIMDYLVQAQGLPPLPEENSVTTHRNLTNPAYRVQRPANAQILPWTP